MTGDETMEDSGIIKTQYTDREIWDFGVRRGFPENLELSLFRRGAWDFFSEGLTDGTEQEVPEAAATTEIEEAQAEENPESAESNIKIEESNAETEIQEADTTEVGPKDIVLEEPASAIEAPLLEETLPNPIEEYLFENPELTKVMDHIVASALFPQNVIHLFSDIGGNQFRMRAAQSIQGGPDTAFAIFIRSGKDGNQFGIESPDTIRALVAELACVNGEQAGESFSFAPLAQLVLLAAADLVRENAIQGGRFTPSALLNSFDPVRESSFKRFSAPITEIVGDRILTAVTIEDMTQLVEELTTQGVFIKEKAGDRVAYTFASGFRSLPEMFSSAENRFALFRHDADAKGDLLYVLSEGDLSWAFIVKDGDGRIERMNKDGLAKVIAEIFPRSLFCTNCGVSLSPGSRFCEECGAKVE